MQQSTFYMWHVISSLYTILMLYAKYYATIWNKFLSPILLFETESNIQIIFNWSDISCLNSYLSCWMLILEYFFESCISRIQQFYLRLKIRLSDSPNMWFLETLYFENNETLLLNLTCGLLKLFEISCPRLILTLLNYACFHQLWYLLNLVLYPSEFTS